jgi:hypothetical protein
MRNSSRIKGRLQELFGRDKELFLDFARRIKDYSIKWGYDNPEDLWNANPEVEFVEET